MPQAAALSPQLPVHRAGLSLRGSVLVTGGLGDIGQLAGHWVAGAAEGAHVWLLGRSGRAAQPLAASLARHNGCVSMAAADVAAQADMADLLQRIAAAGAPAVTGLLHAGGVLQDALLSRQTAGSLRAVYAPKVPGALCLLGAASSQPLHGTVLFSSLTVTLGTPGQSNYAAGNSGLDSLAGDWLSRGLQSSSVQWGPWASGMALSDPGLVQRFKKAGLGIITGACRAAAGLCALLCPALLRFHLAL